nr:hypothetical protein [Vicinamibacterales bacterium]
MRASLLPVAASLATLLWAAPAGAQPALDELIGKPVTSVTVVADGRELADPAVTSLLDTRVGTPLDVADVRRALRALAALERFDDITVEATPSGAGVALRYLVTRGRRLTGIDFRGDLGLGAGELRESLTARFGRAATRQRADEMADTVAATLRDAGFLEARVGHRVVPDGETAARLVFEVEPGPRFRIRAVTVEGTHPEGEARLLERLRLRPGREWHASDTDARVDQELERLRKSGRYAARLAVTPTRAETAPVLDLRVEIDPGPLVEIAFEGDPLPEGRVED